MNGAGARHPGPRAARRRRARPLAPAAPARGLRRARRRSRSSWRCRSRRPRAAARRSTTCCSPGPPGLGKTSLAQIVAAELEVPFVQTAGPALERKGDIAAFLTALEPRAVFFVDEIHRLPRALEETFYPGDGGRLPADHGRPGRRRAGRDARPAAVHAGRRHDANRAADDAAARPLRDPAPPRALLRPTTCARIVRRSARLLEVDDRRRRRARDRRSAAAARRASQTGCSSACATTPRSARAAW